MNFNSLLVEKLKLYGVGRRKLDDDLFAADKPPPRLGLCDVDDESLCHEVIKSSCNVPGCTFTADSLLEFENHYNALHRYACSECKKILPSPHLLDLHLQEKHDSFFAVMAEKKSSYCCYIEECKEKFLNADHRLDHCVKIHKLPKDFRFDQKPKPLKKAKAKKKNSDTADVNSMELDNNTREVQQFSFSNSKQKAFSKYTGRKFTKDSKANSNSGSSDVNMDDIVEDLKESLP